MTTELKESGNNRSGRDRPDQQTIAAFIFLVFLVGTNFIAVRFSNRELSPFWGAGTRFAIAGSLFLIYSLVRRDPLPGGRGFVGPLSFGVLQFGLGYALMYWALLEVPAGLASVVLATVPLFTLIFAGVAKIEKITLTGVLGSLIAFAGIAVIYSESSGGGISAARIIAVVGAAVCFALGGVIVKLTPSVRPPLMNALGMLTGASVLIVLSFSFGEMHALPTKPETWLAFLYLVFLGSIAVFALLLFTIRRWTASGVSYQLVLSPIVAILLSAWLLGESPSPGLIIGGTLVLIGVYVGALMTSRR
jgi:drug/metabolite transporter (DMT)-like permease